MRHLLVRKHVINIADGFRLIPVVLCTEQQTIPLLYNKGEGSLNVPLSVVLLLIHGSFPYINVVQNAISLEPAVFSGLTVHGPYTLLWAGPFPPKIAASPWRIRISNLIHGFFGPPESTAQTAPRSVEPFCRIYGRFQ